MGNRRDLRRPIMPFTDVLSFFLFPPPPPPPSAVRIRRSRTNVAMCFARGPPPFFPSHRSFSFSHLFLLCRTAQGAKKEKRREQDGSVKNPSLSLFPFAKYSFFFFFFFFFYLQILSYASRRSEGRKGLGECKPSMNLEAPFLSLPFFPSLFFPLWSR